MATGTKNSKIEGPQTEQNRIIFYLKKSEIDLDVKFDVNSLVVQKNPAEYYAHILCILRDFGKKIFYNGNKLQNSKIVFNAAHYDIVAIFPIMPLNCRNSKTDITKISQTYRRGKRKNISAKNFF